mgnify:CR=1 FL=1
MPHFKLYPDDTPLNDIASELIRTNTTHHQRIKLISVFILIVLSGGLYWTLIVSAPVFALLLKTHATPEWTWVMYCCLTIFVILLNSTYQLTSRLENKLLRYKNTGKRHEYILNSLKNLQNRGMRLSIDEHRITLFTPNFSSQTSSKINKNGQF